MKITEKSKVRDSRDPSQVITKTVQQCPYNNAAIETRHTRFVQQPNPLPRQRHHSVRLRVDFVVFVTQQLVRVVWRETDRGCVLVLWAQHAYDVVRVVVQRDGHLTGVQCRRRVHVDAVVDGGRRSRVRELAGDVRAVLCVRYQ